MACELTLNIFQINNLLLLIFNLPEFAILLVICALSLSNTQLKWTMYYHLIN